MVGSSQGVGDRFIVTQSGNVGIGTTRPSTNLHVVGTTGTGFTLEQSGGAATALFKNTQTAVDGNTISSFLGQGFNSTPANFQYGSIKLIADDVDAGTEDSSYTFTTRVNGTATDVMSIYGGGVGIGTTTPIQKLDVAGAIRSGNGAGFGTVTLNGATAAAATQTGFLSWHGGNGTRYGYMGNAAGDIDLELENSADFLIQGGNVGIGTTGPGLSSIGTTLTIESTSAATALELSRKSDSLNDGDELGRVSFYHGSATQREGARILAQAAASSEQAADLMFYTMTGGTLGARMTIQDNGNVGIGTTTPGALLDLRGTGSEKLYLVQYSTDTSESVQRFQKARGTPTVPTIIASGDGIGQIGFQGYDGTQFLSTASIVSYVDGSPATNDMPGRLSFFTTADGANGGTERMTIKNTGVVSVGTSTPFLDTRKFVVANNGANVMAVDRIGDGGSVIDFSFASTNVGNITVSGVSTIYNTSSDRRVKKNISETVLGLDTLIQIPVNDFNFINDPNGPRQQGFIAQELYDIYPNAVTTNGDDGIVELDTPNKNPWSVDYGRLTPLLVKSIQELDAKINEVASGQQNILGVNFDLQNKDIINVRNILSQSGNWSIDENGKLVVKEIETDKLTVKGNGITIHDRITGEPVCVFSENSILKSEVGACGTPFSVQPPADSEAPTIQIIGDNPASISIGSTYAIITISGNRVRIHIV